MIGVKVTVIQKKYARKINQQAKVQNNERLFN
jgi:hypothetical protein